MSDAITLHHGELEFPALAAGDGPAVLLLHGFPDGPETWEHQLEALAGAGHRAIAPTLRGYAPEAQPADGDYHTIRMAEDVVAWVEQLGGRAHLIGHDWGATIGFAACALAPERFASFSALAVPHPTRMAEVSASDPAQLARFQYIMDFQAPDAESRVAADDFGYLEDLWRGWSLGWSIPDHALSAMKARFAKPGVLSAALAYYRQAMDVGSEAAAAGQRLLAGPFLVSTLGLAGRDDGCISAEVFAASMRHSDFPGGLQVEVVEGAGHFLHRERPDEVSRLLLEWLSAQHS
ncbi:alpha/beta fold hydrolase [Sphingomonas arenae]|uniref:alpha/beta fold hydrolase n=1 Tax=Sphingomonas arenae TaxID=2812555 RepID=UPI001967E03B